MREPFTHLCVSIYADNNGFRNKLHAKRNHKVNMIEIRKKMC